MCTTEKRKKTSLKQTIIYNFKKRKKKFSATSFQFIFSLQTPGSIEKIYCLSAKSDRITDGEAAGPI